MRIGFVSEALPYLPVRDGFRLCGANLIRHLAGRHEIHLVSFLVDDDVAHLEWASGFCASVQTIDVRRRRRWLAPLSAMSAYVWGRPLQQRRRLGRLLRGAAQRWDVMHVEGPYVAGLIPVPPPIPSILSAHDSWTLRCEEMVRCTGTAGDRLYYRLLKHQAARVERLIYPRFGRCVFVAERDAAAVRSIAPRATCVVVGNGVDTEYYMPGTGPKNPSTIVFHGHLGYAPNVDAALSFARRIFPLVRRAMPEARFQMVGAAPTSRIKELATQPGITLAADVPDIRELLRPAQVYASAVQHGTGIKNKILEAMALGLPVVCFPASLEGIDAEPGRHVLVARSDEEFAGHVLDLLRNPQEGLEIGRAARRFVEKGFSWASRAADFERLYTEVKNEARLPLVRGEPSPRQDSPHGAGNG